MEQMIEVAAVDDHPIVLKGLVSLLDGAPGVTVVATARTVGELLGGPGRQAGVVLLDLDLGDGTSAADNIRRLLAAGPAVVVFSATAAPPAVRAAVSAGAAGYVPKTENVDDLLTAIRAAADGGGWVSPHLAFLLLTDDAPDRPPLSGQERSALQLYAAGLPMKSVARRLGVSPETAKQYVDRVRLKYRRAGRDATTKVDLYQRAVEDGHLPDRPDRHPPPRSFVACAPSPLPPCSRRGHAGRPMTEPTPSRRGREITPPPQGTPAAAPSVRSVCAAADLSS